MEYFKLLLLKLYLDFASFIYRWQVVISFDGSLSRVQTRVQSFREYRDPLYISSFLLEKCFSVSFIETQ